MVHTLSAQQSAQYAHTALETANATPPFDAAVVSIGAPGDWDDVSGKSAGLPLAVAMYVASDSTLQMIYTLLSDVQRNADDLRQDIREVLLGRLHHDQPVHGQYGSVQRTSRRTRSLKDDGEVIGVLEEAGIPRERILAVDREKVDDALDVTNLPETEVYEIEESEYVRKADVDAKRKETRLQGLKDQLVLSNDPDAEELHQEVSELEQRIEELTEFKPGTEVGSRS